MPPKKNPVVEPSEDSDLYTLVKSMSIQLANVNTKMEKVDAIEDIVTEVRTLRVLLEDLKAENRQLKTEMKDKDKKLADMQEQLKTQDIRLNNMDQHHRSWSARVMNIPLTEEEEFDTNAVINKVYELALLPILTGAKNAGLLMQIPSAHQLLETAHVLPGNLKPGQFKPIIFRFYTRNLKNLCFRLKKEHAARVPGGTRTGGREEGRPEDVERGGERGGYKGKGRYCYPFYEDLTKTNFTLMRNISKDSRVQACWSSNGRILFKLQDSNIVKSVGSIHEPIDSLLKK
jgi:hypothetical protein